MPGAGAVHLINGATMRDRTMAHRMLEKKPVKVVAVALANRMARVVWALIRTGESYRATPA